MSRCATAAAAAAAAVEAEAEVATQKQQQTGQTSVVLADVGKRILGHLSQVQAQGEGEEKTSEREQNRQQQAERWTVDGHPLHCKPLSTHASLARSSAGVWCTQKKNILIFEVIFLFTKRKLVQ